MSSESAKGMIDVSFRVLATHHERDDRTKLLMDWDGSQLYVIAGGDL